MKIRLWTIQKKEVWEELNKNKVFYASKEFIDPDWLNGYDWMISQMKTRIGKPDYNNAYPFWAWYQYDNYNKKKPDLRRTAHLPRGSEGVRIEFFKNQSEVLLSDFHLWHFPLTYKGFIGDNEEDGIGFEKELCDLNLENIGFEAYPKEIKDKIVKSWSKIFDMDFDNPDYTYDCNHKMIQATFWSLSIYEVVKVDYFKAR